MIKNFWFFVGGIIFLMASYKTFVTQKIIGKAGIIDLGGYAYIIAVVLFSVSIFLFYVSISEKSN